MLGAKLIAELRDSGTPPVCLAPGRELLKAEPHATASEVIEAMVAANVKPGTIEKAKRIVQDGYYIPPQSRSEADNVEDEILAQQAIAKTKAAAKKKYGAKAEEEALASEPVTVEGDE